MTGGVAMAATVHPTAMLAVLGGSGQFEEKQLLEMLILWALAVIITSIAWMRVWRRPADQVTGGRPAKVAWLAAILLGWRTVGWLYVPVGG